MHIQAPKLSQQGLSLIELMIALSLSLILTLGMVELFNANRQSLATIHDSNDILDNAQFSLSVLRDHIHMADYWGGLSMTDFGLAESTPSEAYQNCGSAWAVNVNKGILGFEGQATASDLIGLPDDCLGKDYVADSDVLLIRYADPSEEFRDSSLNNKRNRRRYFFRSALGVGGYLFSGSQYGLALKRVPTSPRAVNRALSVSLFFIEKCSEEEGCARQGASLSRISLSGGRFIKQRLVNGIEHLQLEYGVDLDADGHVDQYKIASNIDNWDVVLSVRVYLLAGGNHRDRHLAMGGKSYQLGRLSVYDFIPDQTKMFYKYKLFQSEFSLKNRSY